MVIPQRSLLVTDVFKTAHHLKAVLCILSCNFKKNKLVSEIVLLLCFTDFVRAPGTKLTSFFLYDYKFWAQGTFIIFALASPSRFQCSYAGSGTCRAKP